MWGRRKREAKQEVSKAGFILRALDQGMESLSATGVPGQAVAANDDMLRSYWAQDVDWRTLWFLAAKRNINSFRSIGVSFYSPIPGEPGVETTVPHLAASPYWVEDQDEVGGTRPLSVLAFLAAPIRVQVAQDHATDPAVLGLMMSDPLSAVSTHAYINLGRRGLAAPL